MRKRPKEGQRQHKDYLANAEDALIHEFDTIFGGPYVGGDTRNSESNYNREVKGPLLTSYVVDNSSQRNQLSPISFT